MFACPKANSHHELQTCSTRDGIVCPGEYTLVYLKLGVDFLPKNWEFRVFAKQPLSKKLGILRFRQTGHIQKIGTFMIRTELINRGASFRWSFGPHSAWGSIESTTTLTTHSSLRNIFYSRNELYKQITHND